MISFMMENDMKGFLYSVTSIKLNTFTKTTQTYNQIVMDTTVSYKLNTLQYNNSD